MSAGIEVASAPGVLVLDEHDLACLLEDGGVTLDSLVGAADLVASFGSAAQGRSGLRRRGLLDDADPPKPRGALAGIVAIVTRPDLMLGLYERKPPVPSTVLAFARDSSGLVVEPLPVARWEPVPPIEAEQGSVGGPDGAAEEPPPPRRPLYQLGIASVPVDDLIDEAIRRTVLAGVEPTAPPQPCEPFPEAAWNLALRAVGQDRPDEAVLQLRAVGVDREVAKELTAAAAGVFIGGGALAQAREGEVVTQDDIGWFAPRDEGLPWILVEVPSVGEVAVVSTTASGVAGRVRALVEEVR